jgi:hypothetical protein
MPPVATRGWLSGTAAALATAVGLVFVPTALAQDAAGEAAPDPAELQGAGGGTDQPPPPPPPGPKPADLHLTVKGIDGSKVDVGKKIAAIGRLRPFVPGQHVTIQLARNSTVIKRKTPLVRQIGDQNVGRFRLLSDRIVEPGKYRVRVFKERNRNQVVQRAARASRLLHLARQQVQRRHRAWSDGVPEDEPDAAKLQRHPGHL